MKSYKSLLNVMAKHTAQRIGDDILAEKKREANARLMAAAPDLLEALQDIVSFWDEHVPTDCINDMHKKARAAIAKATAPTYKVEII